jgi:polyamine oxidase
LNAFIFYVPKILAASSSKSGNQNEIHTDVVIIGGGASGIAAAQILHEANISFVLLEADQRIGGRIQNQQIGKYLVENGANWIHGPYTEDDPPINNPVWTLKNKYDMKGNFTDWEDMHLMTKDGKRVEDKHMSKWWDRIENAQSSCSDHGESLWEKAKRENIKNPESLDISVEECLVLQGYILNNDTDLDTLVGKTFKYLEFDSDETIPPSNMSLMLWTYEPMNAIEYIDKDYFITDQRGYNIFLRKIAQPFETSVKLRHKVTHIDHDEYSVMIRATVSDKDNDNTEGRKVGKKNLKVRAKYAICTVSLGVLQNSVIKFNPDLTMKKKNSIRSMKMSNYAKVYLQFPYNFWGEDEYLVFLGEPIGFATWALNLDHPKYFPGSNMITIHFVGDDAIKIESQDIQKTKLELIKQLRKTYPDVVPEPLEMHVTNWTNNPLTYGSYSAKPMGFTRRMWMELKENVGRLYFSGEHTNENFHATVHGAFEAGKQTANEVIEELRTTKSEAYSSNAAMSLHLILCQQLLIHLLSFVALL